MDMTEEIDATKLKELIEKGKEKEKEKKADGGAEEQKSTDNVLDVTTTSPDKKLPPLAEVKTDLVASLALPADVIKEGDKDTKHSEKTPFSQMSESIKEANDRLKKNRNSIGF